MLPSALRTLSVLTLLSAVSGSVILTHGGSPDAEEATSAAGAALGPSAFSRPTLDRPTFDRASRSQARTFLESSFVQNATAFSDADEQRHLRSQRAEDVAQEVAQAKAERARKKKAQERKARERKERQERQEAAEQARRTARSNPQAAARALLADRGWSGQFGCLDALWTKESNWNYRASNPSSGAYGIPQSLPGSKMASAGSDWRTNPLTQMTWGLDYIGDRYGTPCGAWGHSQSTGWY